MAEETKATAKKAPAKKTAAKKTAAKKTARKTTARKTAARKTTARKTTARKAAPKQNAAVKQAEEFGVQAREAGRNAFLASLGFYGKAYDQLQEQFSNIQDELTARRKKADKVYQDLIKRGKKVEKDAKSAINDIELPKVELDNLTDRKELDKQLKKAKARFEDLREQVNFRNAA